MTKYEVTYHNETTNNESGNTYVDLTLTEVLELAASFRKDGEYVYITNTDTNETFITFNGFEFSVVPEV